MLETEFLFFQGMKKRIDQRISEGNYDEAAVSMQKCMEYILNSLDGRNNDYQKVCVLFVTPGKTAQDKVLFSSFMEKLYDMMIAAADLNPKHPKVQVDLFDYPLHGVIEGLDDYMKYGNDKGIYTTLYTECKDIETIDQEECMEHINEIYDHCKIDILIEDTDSSLHYTHKCGNTTIGEEPEIPGMSCHSNDPKYREIIKCKDNEDAIECHCYMYRSENHPYPIPENTEDLLTMYSKRR